MMEEIKYVLDDTEIGLNKDSIMAIILFNREMDLMQSVINTIKSGNVWAEYQGDRDVENMDLELFTFHLSSMRPMNQETFKINRPGIKSKYSDDDKFDNFINKIPHLLCVQNFLEAGMTDEDVVNLFNRYFPQAKINIDDCDFIRQRFDEHIDIGTEKELEQKSREIVDIMMKRSRLL